MQVYSDPSREQEPHALPDVEVFHSDEYERIAFESGWHWRYWLPKCLTDSSPHGPFDTEALAIANAQAGKEVA